MESSIAYFKDDTENLSKSSLLQIFFFNLFSIPEHNLFLRIVNRWLRIRKTLPISQTQFGSFQLEKPLISDRVKTTTYTVY